ncbi:MULTISPECIES: MucBP domain-containing protein [Lactobacillaceae]|uniref:MucBP domain-containing protein n=1 Tax=Lactobacillaceae TaxID=33958 RepID=UPI00145656E3|nr:MucBP domain-containing protein [Lactobacillus sp. HBUAS51381]NLR08455.1 KxYKxGKxW signal peptide domain-containing protein [Lactobacillus sp. HBUAS51381]
MRNWAGETKVHYKSYKAGKHWVVASITAVTLGLGLMGATETAQAAEGTPSPTSEETASGQAAQPDRQVTLQGTPTAEADVVEKADVVEENEGKDAAPVEEQQAVKEDNSTNINKEEQQEPAEVPAGDTEGQLPSDQNDPSGEPEDSNTVETPQTPAPAPQDVVKDSGNVDLDTSASKTPAPQPLKAMRAAVQASPIDGVNASEWIPDAALRDMIIKQLNRQVNHSGITGLPYYVADENNLYQHVGDLTSLNDYVGAGTVTSLAGLAYFPNLHTLNFTRVTVPVAGLIDFSTLPLLNDITLVLADDSASHDLTTIMDTYFGNGMNLRFLRLGNSHLTGSLDVLSRYTDLEMVYLPNNQLTGSIPDLKALPNLWYLMLNNNQLTGNLPDIGDWPALNTIDVSYNELTGDLPDLSHFRGELVYMFNHLTNGVVTLLDENGQPSLNYGVYQRLTGNTITLSADNQAFDPVSGVINRMQDMTTGQPDETEGVGTAQLASGVTVAYGDLDPNLPTTEIADWAANTAENATDWFQIIRYGDKWGLTFTPKQAVPDGMYTVHVINQSYGANWGYSAYLTFKIENKVPIDPGTPDPGKPDPGVTTGTVTIVNVDQDGHVISQSQQTGNVGDAFTINADDLDGYQLVGNGVANGTYTAAGQTITFTYQAVTTGGDGDLIEPDRPVTDETEQPGADGVVAGGAGDQVATQGQSGHLVATPLTTEKAQDRTATQKQAKANATATTLPQTDEATMSPLAGLALLLGSVLTGFTLKRKRHQ